MCMGMRGSLRYQKYGKATTCKNGKGYSAYANDVYSIGGKNIQIDKKFIFSYVFYMFKSYQMDKCFNG